MNTHLLDGDYNNIAYYKLCFDCKSRLLIPGTTVYSVTNRSIIRTKILYTTGIFIGERPDNDEKQVTRMNTYD